MNVSPRSFASRGLLVAAVLCTLALSACGLTDPAAKPQGPPGAADAPAEPTREQAMATAFGVPSAASDGPPDGSGAAADGAPVREVLIHLRVDGIDGVGRPRTRDSAARAADDCARAVAWRPGCRVVGVEPAMGYVIVHVETPDADGTAQDAGAALRAAGAAEGSFAAIKPEAAGGQTRTVAF